MYNFEAITVQHKVQAYKDTAEAVKVIRNRKKIIINF